MKVLLMAKANVSVQQVRDAYTTTFISTQLQSTARITERKSDFGNVPKIFAASGKNPPLVRRA